ncbi:MAG TPA: Ig-like domain-containing protein [Candidatus Eisenbacteria bacterium]|nr:Ig-like domain-containing protein [Candidatus Eisenbacteria bacterium]
MRRFAGFLHTTVAALFVAGGLFTSAPAAAAPPVLSLPGPQTVSEGTDLTFTVSATDPDNQTVFLFAANLPTGATFTDHFNNTGTFDWTPNTDQAGSYVVSFLADDDFGGTDQGSVSIEVTNANTAPVLFAIGDRTVEQGTTQFVSLTGYDPDGDAVTFSSGPLPAYATLSDYGGGSGNITLAPSLSTPLGTTSITVRLSDGQATVEQSFNVTVTASQVQNRPPVLAAIGNQTVAEGQVRHVAVSASDPDGNNLTWSVTLPSFAVLTPVSSGPGSLAATLDLSPGYCQSGSYSATISVWDGTALDWETFTITVTNTNRAPAWDQPSYSASLGEGAVTAVAVSASDPDESCTPGAPNLSIKSSDAGAALQASLTDAGDGTGNLTLTAATNGVGTYHVILTAADWADPGLTRDVVVTVTVTHVETGPVARAWSEADPIKLNIGKPRERVYLEPVTGFAVADVDPASLRLTAWTGSGTVEAIAPLVESVDGTHDRDGNGALELRMDFTKDDLRALFANLTTPVAADMTLHATLLNGTAVTAHVSTSVVPERGVIKKLGPNPLNPEAVVTVLTPQDGGLRIRVFDARGRMVRLLMDESNVPAGTHLVRFDGKDDRGKTLASGRYYVQAETPYTKDVSPVTILK